MKDLQNAVIERGYEILSDSEILALALGMSDKRGVETVTKIADRYGLLGLCNRPLEHLLCENFKDSRCIQIGAIYEFCKRLYMQSEAKQ